MLSNYIRPIPASLGLAMLAALVAATLQPTEMGRTIVGRASVIDGDTLKIAGKRIRLSGIDAPEARQECSDAAGEDYRCGLSAAQALRVFLDMARPARCREEGRDRWGRIVARCHRADGADAASYLVRSGHAVDWPRYSKGRYASVQDAAKAEGRGVWQGAFQAPWDWRRHH